MTLAAFQSGRPLSDETVIIVLRLVSLMFNNAWDSASAADITTEVW